MATTIVPSTGAAPLFLQAGQGTTPGYSAIDLRRADSAGLQEGVIGATDFMVVQRGAGANLSVDITMTAGGGALVQGDSVSGQGLYYVSVHSGTVNETVTAAHATLPRIDTVVLEVLDDTHDGLGSNLVRVRVIAGTATAGATLANRTGVASLPSNALLLADILVAATDTAISNSEIRDRRKWARGAYVRITRASADYTTVATSHGLVDSTNLQPRIECSGVPVRATLKAIARNSGAGNSVELDLFQDGSAVSQRVFCGGTGYPASMNFIANVNWQTVPAAGSHLLGPSWAVNAGTGTLVASTVFALEFTVEEIVRQNTVNNSTTTG